ncbi:Hypp9033 [Branchiostoma lanceolatum]|uniref:Hypp9033 protein n=1 Tax=Branchiostoma lanceolatum TaxID=7740 RepID=A0A8J9ZCA5_BRALA|nr:Hypp9033 [Branchiostoma lanceolatum]
MKRFESVVEGPIVEGPPTVTWRPSRRCWPAAKPRPDVVRGLWVGTTDRNEKNERWKGSRRDDRDVTATPQYVTSLIDGCQAKKGNIALLEAQPTIHG